MSQLGLGVDTTFWVGNPEIWTWAGSSSEVAFVGIRRFWRVFPQPTASLQTLFAIALATFALVASVKKKIALQSVSFAWV